MRACRAQGLALCLAVLAAALPTHANRLTFEVWPDASPDHAVSCSIALSEGWISLVQVTGAGMPRPDPIRWRATEDEMDAVTDVLQALVEGELASVDPLLSRQPPAPFLSVTWMTRLDGRLATGLYMQPGLALPGPLAQALAALGLSQACGLSAIAGE